ncbi:hypothetical protein VTJ83DRAFT_1482 [Remersonia thermophila]|uniref:Uncharacterized protein n=1 Tax=Remersonia thermophila TaxID=72144 RepID=A0ABR4DG20_9PEZI
MGVLSLRSQRSPYGDTMTRGHTGEPATIPLPAPSLGPFTQRRFSTTTLPITSPSATAPPTSPSSATRPAVSTTTSSIPHPKGRWNPPITSTTPVHEVLAFTQHNLCAIHAAYADLFECSEGPSQPPGSDKNPASDPTPGNFPEQLHLIQDDSLEGPEITHGSSSPTARVKIKPADVNPSKVRNAALELITCNDDDDDPDFFSYSAASSTPEAELESPKDEEKEAIHAALAATSSTKRASTSASTSTISQPLQHLHALASESLLLSRLLDLLSDFPHMHTSPVIAAQARHTMLAVVALGATLRAMVSSSQPQQQQQQQQQQRGAGRGGDVMVATAAADAREQVAAVMRAAMKGVEEATMGGGASFVLPTPAPAPARRRRTSAEDEERRKRKRMVRRGGVLARILWLRGTETAASILEGMWARMRERREALEGAIRGCKVSVRGNVHDGWSLSRHQVTEVNERFKALTGRELLMVELLRRRIENGKGDVCRLNDHESAILGLPQTTSARVEQWRVCVSHDPEAACISHA